MATARGRGVLAIVVALVFLALGAGAAVVLGHGPEAADRDIAIVWCGRVLLVLAAAWLLIGMLAARTRIVRRPGAAAARATWIGSTRPWRARESTLGLLLLDRWLLLIVPAGLLVATRLLQTASFSWTAALVDVAAWLVFALVVRLVVGRRSPWPVIAAAGGVIVLRCILTLAALSLSGPDGSWPAVWASPVARTACVAVAVALALWLFVAVGWALSVQTGVRRAWGAVLAAAGAGITASAAAAATMGGGTAVAAPGDELGLLPWGPAWLLELTTPRDVAHAALAVAAAFGAVLCVVGALLAVPRHRADAAS